MNLIGYKPISGYTFDDCVNHIERCKSEGIAPDENVVKTKEHLQVQREEEEIFFDNNKKTTKGCKEYLKKHPDGRFKDEAVKIIKRKQKRRIIWICTSSLIFAVVVSLFIVYSLSASYIHIYKNDRRIKNNEVLVSALGETMEFEFYDDAISRVAEMDYVPDDWLKVKLRYPRMTIVVSPNKTTSPREENIFVDVYSTLFGIKIKQTWEMITIRQPPIHQSFEEPNKQKKAKAA